MRIKKFDDFKKSSINEEEGWKDIALGAAMAAGTLIPNQASSQSKNIDIKFPGREVTRTVTKSATTEDQVEKLQKMGYKLNKTTVDTIWTTITEKAPETPVQVTKISYDDNQYFASGVYTLSPEMKDSIDQTIEYIISNNNDILAISVESSTDKQGLSTKLQNELKSKGYEPSNKGLSKARCESISNYLVTSKGIDESIIDTLNQAEMGEGIVDPSARYVVVKLVYMKKEDTRAADITKQVPELKTTYFLSKDVTTKKYHHLKIRLPHIKIKHHRSKVKYHKNLTDCFSF
jgi:outer membrane protein OmpA-like peptidoglycan-associated protein